MRLIRIRFLLSKSDTRNYMEYVNFVNYRTYNFVSPPGLEPGTQSLKGSCSNQLSYGPSIRRSRIIP